MRLHRRAVHGALALLLAGGAAAVGGVVPASVSTAATGQRIVRQDVDIRIEDSGSLLVTEVIDYDFGDGIHHGILRAIPTRERFDDEQDRRYPLEVLSVDGSPGTPDQYTTAERAGVTHIKIGDPQRTVTGVHTYTLTYRVRGALNHFPGHDELYWDAIGDRSSVAAELATVRVTAPGGVTRVACFAGATSTRPCTRATKDGPTAAFTHGRLAPFEALTVAVAFPAGAVPTLQPILDRRLAPGSWTLAGFRHAFAFTPATVAATVSAGALVLAVFAILLWRSGRDRRYSGSAVDAAFGCSGGEQRVGLLQDRRVPVEFTPPEGVSPAQAGLLIDERVQTRDVIATLIDLARQGHLRIEEIGENGRGPKNWKLVKLRESDELLEHERLLIHALFRHRTRPNQVLLSELEDRFAANLHTVQDALYRDGMANGWFAHRPDHVRRRWTIAGVGLAVAGVALLAAAVAHTRMALPATSVVFAGLLLAAGARWMPRRTAKGTALATRVQGFRRFIEEADAERARFAEQRRLFTDYLPYAIVFGCADKWAKVFAGLDGVPEPDWYGGAYLFSPLGFTHRLGRFSASAGATLASTPGSSSGSASGESGFSGGFAGAGAGGGGTSSW